MSNYDKTLLGFIGGVCKDLKKAMDEDNSTVATTEDVKEIINEIVNQTFINSISAVSAEPTTATIDNILYVFCNGTPVVITAREDGEEGATITWDGGSLNVPKKSNVFGGRHDDDTLTNSNITIESGEVDYIFGGGLHKSHTVRVYIEMTGGKVKNLRGGGADSYTTKCSCSTPNYSGEAKTSHVIVEEANISITGGEVTDLLFGGGNGISYTGKANIVIGGTANCPGWNVAGGSNGYTGSSNLVVNSGSMNILMGICRGIMDKINIVINGGTINNLYAGGEIPFIGTPDKPNSNDASGKFGLSTVTINGGEIISISAGGNDYLVIEDGDPSVSIEDYR